MKKLLMLLLSLFLGIIVLTGCSNKITNTSDVFSFLNNSSDTYIKVRKESGINGLRPGSLNKVVYSDKGIDINNILTMLNQKVTKTDESITPDNEYIDYKFYKNEESYDEIYISCDMIRYKGNYYLLNENYDYDFKQENQIYSFVTFDEIGKVYKNDQYIEDFNKVDKLEFVKTDTINKEPILTLDCTFFELFILSQNEFYIKSSSYTNSYEYYKVVGDVDFSSIIK